MLPLRDWIKEIYLNLLKDGWKLNDIDEMDLGWYFDLINYAEEKKYRGNVEAVLSIL